MSGLREVKPEKPKSEECIIEILRGLIDTAYKEKILYLEINMKTESDKSLRSFTVGTHPPRY